MNSGSMDRRFRDNEIMKFRLCHVSFDHFGIAGSIAHDGHIIKEEVEIALIAEE